MENELENLRLEVFNVKTLADHSIALRKLVLMVEALIYIHPTPDLVRQRYLELIRPSEPKSD